MINAPFIIFVLGALIAGCVTGDRRRWVLLATPLVGLINLFLIKDASAWSFMWFGLTVTPFQTDSLSWLFGLLFHVACVIGVIFSWHVTRTSEQLAALLYPASALGVVFAGDLISVFLFWEALALTSVVFIISNGTVKAMQSAIRYLVFQVLSGVLLLSGALMLVADGHGLGLLGIELNSTGAWLLLIAFGIKAAFPFAHTWLADAYPEATPSGTVFLSAFTTKVAVYMLARCFAGESVLVYVGVTMACFPIFYAVIENDLRRVLAYSMINQIGFMVCGVGMGTELAINGAVAHAFNDVIFKGLLMMSMGAVLFRTGEMRGSELGGLARTMPKTAGLCMVGAASISAFPLFSGFVSKSMVMAALLIEQHPIAWLCMLFASAGVFHHAGIKIPFFAFFAHDSGKRPEEAPKHMIIAMSISAVLCVLIGCFPNLLYQYLPYSTDYSAYDAAHVAEQMQILFFSALAFVWLQMAGIYPPELRSTNIDTDWFYRRAWPAVYQRIVALAARWDQAWRMGVQRIASGAGPSMERWGQALLVPWRSSDSLTWVLILFALTLVVFFTQLA